MNAHLPRAAIGGLLLLTLAGPAPGQSFWTPTGGGNWFNPASNWSPSVPNAAGAAAAFAQGGSGSFAVNLDAPVTLGQLSSSSAKSYTLSGSSLTMNGGALIPTISADRSGNFRIDAPVVLTPSQIDIFNAGFSASGSMSSGLLTIASLTGSDNVVRVNPAGTVVPSVVVIENGSYGGPNSQTSHQGGVLRATDGVGIPTNTNMRLSGGYWDQAASVTITRPLGTAPGQIQMTSSVGFGAFNGPVTLNFGSGAALQWGVTSFNPTRVQFGRGVTAGGNDSYFWLNPIDLDGADRTIAAGVGSGVRATVRLSGVLSNSSGTAAGLVVQTSGGGEGVVELTGANTYDGTTSVTAASILRAADGAGLSPNSNLLLSSGVLEPIGATTFNRPLGTAAGQVRLPGTGTAGFSAFGGTHTVQIGGPTVPTVIWGTTHFNPGVLRLGSATSDALTDFRNPIDLSAGAASPSNVRFLEVRNNVSSTTDVGRFSGVISNSGATGTGVALAVNGNGVVELAAANTYNIQTVVTSPLVGAGLRLVGGGSFANSPVVTVDVGETLDVSAVTSGANFSVAANRFLLAPNQQLAGTGTVIGPVLIGPGASVRGGSPTTVLNQPTGQLTVSGPLRLVGASPGPSAGLHVDLNGATASGATVSRVAVTGGTLDLAATAGPGGSPVVIRLLNDSGLTAGQAYSFTVASADGGFTRDGNPVAGFNFGSDFTLESATFGAFSNVSLAASGPNLTLTFTPVPEPGVVLGVGAVAALAARRLRRFRTNRGIGAVSKPSVGII